MSHFSDQGEETGVPNMSAEAVEAQNTPESTLKHSKRPRLTHLRSVWASTANEQGPVFKDEPMAIALPAVELLPPTEPIVREIRCLAGAACALCLINSLAGVSLVGARGVSLQFAFGWSCMMIWTYLTSNIGQTSFLAQCSVVAMIATDLLYHQTASSLPPWIAALPLCALCLFVAVHRIHCANERQCHAWEHRMIAQRTEAQKVVDSSLAKFSDQRLAFLETVSREVQDAALMVISTLEQFSPASILTNTHELLSACSIAVPIASISAINTTIKQVCHISSHLHLVSKLLHNSLTLDTRASVMDESNSRSAVRQEFDVGELAQNVGDALAGMSAKLDVYFVLYHSGDGFHYSNVIGDEGAIKYALLNLLRDILEGCTPGACIELGLNVTDTSEHQRTVTFEIIHTIPLAAPKGLCASLLPNANFTLQLLNYAGARLTVDDSGKNRTRFKVSMQFEPGSENGERLLFIERPSQILEKYLSSVKFSDEPTLSQLNAFIASLKGIKMVLHAPEQSVFAKHLTSCLTGWNADISHVPVISEDEGAGDDLISNCSTDGGDTDVATPSTSGTSSQPATTPASAPSRTSASSPKIPSPALEEEHLHSIPPTFVLIDDDFPSLEKKLREFQMLPSAPVNVLQDHYQQLRRHRRSKSSGPSPNFFHQGTTAIIFFASLDNFRRVRDTVHWFSLSPHSHPFSMPRVVVVPKPAGPRRFLTALHTAWNNAVVEPQFLPIATSPLNHAPPSSASISATMLEARTPPTPKSDARASPRQSPGNEINNYFFDVSNGSPTSSVPSTSSTVSNVAKRRMRSKSQSGRAPPPRPTDNLLSAINDARPPTQLSTITSGRPSPAASPPASNNATNSVTVATMTPTVASPIPMPTIANAAISPSGLKFETDMSVPDEAENKLPPKKPAGPKAGHRKRKTKSKPQSSLSSPPIKVLIVEDNMINQAILSTWMRKHKIKFSVASDGKEAVEKWQDGGFHLVLMDIQLPVMSGIDATKKIRAIEKTKKIGVLPTTCPSPSTSTLSLMSTKQTRPLESLEAEAAAAVETMGSQDSAENTMPSIFRSPVIIVALTASSLESDRQAALAAGCNDFLTKPVSLEWLEKKNHGMGMYAGPY